MVVTSLTLTEAETAVHLPIPTATAPEPVNAHVVHRPSAASSADASYETNGVPSDGFPSAILTCRPNSHPFQERKFYGVHEQVKIGRSVARSKPSENNAIFDCKVLSRNHALLWYRDGKFFLQDTKSSNGTFVNNSRLSKGSEESEPREICSGDILQFGVDVQENAKKLTHGCIIATVRLFLPDGKEAKASPTIVSSSGGATTLPQQDLHQLNLYIQEALVREQMLETKLAMLQRLVGQTNQASDEAWKSLIDEDRLLTRVEILESQLSTYGKAMNEDKLRDETKKLMEEKMNYQDTAKQTLKKLVDEKLEAINKQKELEKALSNTEDEYACLKELHDKDVHQNHDLAMQVSRLSSELEEEMAKKSASEENTEDTNNEDGEAKPSLLSGATVTVSVDNEATTTTTCLAAVERGKGEGIDSEVIHEEATAKQNEPEEPLVANETVTVESSEDNLENELKVCKASFEELVNDNNSVTEKLSDAEQRLQEALREIEVKNATIQSLEESREQLQGSSSEEQGSPREDVELRSQIEKLNQDYARLLSDNADLSALVENYKISLAEIEQQQKQLPVPPLSRDKDDIPDLEKSLCEAESKISELLKVKEKFAEVDAERTNLALNLSELEEEMDVLSLQTRTATACSMIPLVILVLAFIVAYLPSLSSLFGTSEKL